METKVISMWEKALELMTDDEVFNLVKAEGLGELYSSVAGEAEDRGYWDAKGKQWRKAKEEEGEMKKAIPLLIHPKRPRKSMPCGHNCGHNCGDNCGDNCGEKEEMDN